MSSGIDETSIALIAATPGVAQGPNGRPQAVAELLVVVLLDKMSGRLLERGPARRPGRRDGVPPDGEDHRRARGQARDRRGHRRRARSAGASRGSRSDRPSRCGRTGRCKIVGVFEDNGSAFESEVWGDMNVIRATFGRQGIVSSVRVRLESPDKFDGFKAEVETNRQLNVDGDARQRVLREVVAGDGEVPVGARVHHRVLLLDRRDHRRDDHDARDGRAASARDRHARARSGSRASRSSSRSCSSRSRSRSSAARSARRRRS